MKNEELRDLILDATKRVIVANGLANTKMDDISEEAKFSKGGIFYYFSSKQELLLGLLQRYERRLCALRDEIYNELLPQPFRKLKAALLALMKYPSRYTGSPSLPIEFLSDKELRAGVFAIKEKLFKEIVAETQDIKTVVWAMLVFDGIALSQMSNREIYPEQYVHTIVNELLSDL